MNECLTTFHTKSFVPSTARVTSAKLFTNQRKCILQPLLNINSKAKTLRYKSYNIHTGLDNAALAQCLVKLKILYPQS